MNTIQSPRVDLIRADLPLLEAVQQGDKALAGLMGVRVPENWTEFGLLPFQYVLQLVQADPEVAAWWTWLPVLRSENALLGSCGFKGRPDAQGEVEIGYEIAPEYRLRGLAKEIAQALVRHAFAQPEVKLVSAHTLAEENASVAVLKSNGFEWAGTLEDPDEGAVWRWELPRAKFEATDLYKGMAYPLRMETARLWTRPVTLDDQAAWAGFLGHPVATQFLPNPENHTPEQRAKLWMERQLGRYADRKLGMLALMHRETGAFIGQAGLLMQEVDGKPELEVGYHVFPEYWRQGYASEAAIALRNLGFAHNLSSSIVSIIHRDNVASQGVALRNGMVRDRATTYMGIDVYLYRIHREAWEQLQAGKSSS